MTTLAEAFARLPGRAERIGVSLSPEQADLLRRHFELVLRRNETMNLTRVTDPDAAVGRLYLSSLSLIPALQTVGVFAEGLFRSFDLGTGGGFPGIPLAVACPHMEVVLADARRKKTEFLARAIGALGLAGRVSALHGRGSELSRRRSDLSGSFDLVTARAVATAAATIEETAGLLRPGGILAVFKGPRLTAEEILAGRGAAEKHGLVFRAEVDTEVEDLTPKLLVYSAWSARDEGAFDG